MIFRILGPLEIDQNGRTIQIGRNRQLVILALMLLNINKTVLVDRLVEAVWGGDPPKTGEEQIQTCIWRLRQFLADVGSDCRIETRTLGYALCMPEDHLDAGLFEARVHEARTAAAGGEPAVAIEKFCEALGLFRGPVLTEVPSAIVQAAAAQWEERRLAAFEEFVELQLALGSDQRLIGELITMVRENPLRERLRGQLMVALDRCGRRADALAVYRAGRHALVTQLGLEPGPKLQELHRQILNGTLQISPPTVGTGPVVVVPGQLPPDTADFHGRECWIDKLVGILTGDSDSLAGAPRSCMVLGKPGVGKTALAVHVAHLVRDRFPDGQLYADLRGTTNESADPAAVLRWFLRGLCVAEARIPNSMPERVALYRSLLTERRVLVMLDDVAEAAQIAPLLAGGAGSAILVTSSTRRAELPGTQVIELDELPDNEAIDFLEHLVGKARVAADHQAVQEIVRAIGGLPLAARIVGTRLARRPHLGLGHLAKRLQDDSRCLDELSHGILGVRTRLADSVRILSDEERMLWYELSLLEPLDFAAWVAAAVHGASLADAECLLDGLVDRHLIAISGEDSTGTVRYRMDRLGSVYARERARTELAPSARDRILDRAMRSWLALAGQAFHTLGDLADPPQRRSGDGPELGVIATVREAPVEWLDVERAGLDLVLRRGRHLDSGVLDHLDRWRCGDSTPAATTHRLGTERS